MSTKREHIRALLIEPYPETTSDREYNLVRYRRNRHHWLHYKRVWEWSNSRPYTSRNRLMRWVVALPTLLWRGGLE